MYQRICTLEIISSCPHKRKNHNTCDVLVLVESALTYFRREAGPSRTGEDKEAMKPIVKTLIERPVCSLEMVVSLSSEIKWSLINITLPELATMEEKQSSNEVHLLKMLSCLG